MRARESRHSYSEVGDTAGVIPPLFTVDHNRMRLGSGAETWERAVEAIRKWKMFDIPWVRLYRSSTPIVAGENVAVCAHFGGVYFLNACRIVYVIDEDGRFGFAYGTLDEHAESGEERFLVEWQRDTNEVWYDLLAFSRPHQFFARIGYPVARRVQKRFAQHSKMAMVRAVHGSMT